MARVEVERFLGMRGIAPIDSQVLSAAIPLIRERARTYADAALALDYFFRDPPEMDQAACAKHWTRSARDLMRQCHGALEGLELWTAPSLEAAVRAFAENQGVTMKDLAQPLRLLVTGRVASPPLFEVLEVLGRTQSLGRITRAIRELEPRA